ncbi:MAG: desulfoferrodoxin [Patescibacteria group bacterium]
MTKINQIYKCAICGNIVEVLHNGAGELVCCGQSMQLMLENIEDVVKEKHVPVIVEMPANQCHGKDGVIIKIGAIEHPMTAEHFIEWVEIITDDGKRGKKFLEPGNKPEVEFYTRKKIIGARAYCNLHGLWQLTV